MKRQSRLEVLAGQDAAGVAEVAEVAGSVAEELGSASAIDELFKDVRPVGTVIIKRSPTVGVWDEYMRGVQDMPVREAVTRAIHLASGIRDFWRDAEGWAPDDSAALLSKSRLDWQVSLTKCLQLWSSPQVGDLGDGVLILGWANLGSLVEGTMKLFLSVWLHSYEDDQLAKRDRKLSAVLRPDMLSFEDLRQVFRKRIWDEPWDEWTAMVQQRRNAIHAYRDRELGSAAEMETAIRAYLGFLRYINARLPYPDDIFEPREALDDMSVTVVLGSFVVAS